MEVFTLNPERFTEASATAINAAQTLAQQNRNQNLTHFHLLQTLLDNDTAPRHNPGRREPE